MKSMKYLVVVSAIMLALVGCDKKERPMPVDSKTDVTANEEAKELTVVERPAMVCDDNDLKTRINDLVLDNVRQSALDTLKKSNLVELEETLKNKLSTLNIEVSDPKTQEDSCVAKISVTLSESDISGADKVLAKASTTLAEQASQMGITLEDGHRLVGDLVYQINGDALSIKSTDNPVIELTSSGLASAVVWASQQKSVANNNDKPQAVKPKVTPINPPAVRPSNPQPTTSTQQPVRTSPPSQQAQQTRNNAQSSQQGNATTASSTRTQQQPARPAEPRAEPRPTPKVETKPTPKPEPKPEPKPTPKPESKPEPSVSHKPVTDNSSEITIVESDDTY